jgi:carbon storage regulator
VLVFTRRRNEAIIVADGIEIRVLRVSRDAVRLGVTAPADVPVHRQEIYEQIREENCRASQPAAGLTDALSRVRAARGTEEG